MSKEDLAAKMRALVSQYRDSGQTRKAFASAHGISAAKLAYWIKKLSGSDVENKKKSSGFGFVTVGIEPAPLSSKDHLLIRLPNGVELEIPM